MSKCANNCHHAEKVREERDANPRGRAAALGLTAEEMAEIDRKASEELAHVLFGIK